MSIILKPEIDLSYLSMITEIACAAVGKVLSEIDNNIRIKWPNDVLINGKKVSGILTEMSGELNELNYIIIGIGINVNQDINDFPGELGKKATSIMIEKNRNYLRKELMCRILEEFEKLYNDFLLYANEKNPDDFFNDLEEYLLKFDLDDKISISQNKCEIKEMKTLGKEDSIIAILNKYKFNVSKMKFEEVKSNYVVGNFTKANRLLINYVESLFIEMADYIKKIDSANSDILNIIPENAATAIQVLEQCSKPIIDRGFIQEFWKELYQDNSCDFSIIDECMYKFQLVLLVTGNLLNRFDTFVVQIHN